MNIVLTGGGTAGHIIPNLALCDNLNKHFKSIYYLGNKNGMEKSLTKYYNVKFKHVDSIKFSRDKFYKNLAILFLLPKYILSAKKLLKSLNVNIVFSKGGYVALPVCIAAYLLKIPVVCHESDYSMGITNKLTSIFAKCVLTSFKETKLKRKYKYIGMPIRNEIFQGDAKIIYERHYIDRKMPILLVMGGSLGSQTINKYLLSILDKLTPYFFVIHITGNSSNTSLKNYISLKFVNDIQNYMKAADLIISRCGSTSAFEISALNKKVLYIPLSKNASRGDQIENAKIFKTMNIANVLYEEDLSASSLYREIFNTYNMQKYTYRYNKNIIEKITDILIKNAKN